MEISLGSYELHHSLKNSLEKILLIIYVDKLVKQTNCLFYPRRDDDASPMSSYGCMLRPT